MIWNVHPSVCLLETVIKDRRLKFLVKIIFLTMSFQYADLSVMLQNIYMYTVIYRFRDFIYILLWIVNILLHILLCVFAYLCYICQPYFLYIHFIKSRIKCFIFSPCSFILSSLSNFLISIYFAFDFR